MLRDERRGTEQTVVRVLVRLIQGGGCVVLSGRRRNQRVCLCGWAHVGDHGLELVVAQGLAVRVVELDEGCAGAPEVAVGVVAAASVVATPVAVAAAAPTAGRPGSVGGASSAPGRPCLAAQRTGAGLPDAPLSHYDR